MSPDAADDAASPSWHALAPEEVLGRLDADRAGLSAAEARRRRALHGPNALLISRPTPWWRILAAQFRGLVVGLLAAAAAVALVVGDLAEALAVGAVLVLNGALGFSMEWRARQAMEALRRLQVQEALVQRDGRRVAVDARELVPGDVIEVEAGGAVPADARLLEAVDLTAVEAPLTGESAPVAKGVEAVGAHEAGEDGAGAVPLAERTSMLYKGTLAAAGSGRAVVVATGLDTEVGRISELVAETESEETPLERRLDRLGRRLVGLTLAVAALVTALGVARGEELWRMVETGIALAVAAVPEGLPVVATMALAVGMQRMARRNALVRRLPAVETLGSATVICSDKTGTLTAGEMAVTRLVVGGADPGGGVEIEVTGVGYAPRGELRRAGEPVQPDAVPGLAALLTAGALANRASVSRDPSGGDGRWVAHGDPTEAALLVVARKAGLHRDRLLAARPRVGEVPFSSERMWMATFHRLPGGGGHACVKGAPRRLVEMSGRSFGHDGAPRALDAEGRERLLQVNRELAARGLRVLALAERELPTGDEPGKEAVRDLTFLGFAGIADPPAPGVAAAVARFRRAGVRTVMITGDQAVTAAAVARELGLLPPPDGAASEPPPGVAADQRMVDGRELNGLPAAELVERVGRAAVFSRTSPEQKLRIVGALKERGEVVAMLGDGVNDAPALKRADIGVAMGGRGTDVAKETAAVVLQDDRFETVAAAVEEGRVIFDNIRKFILYLFSCNLAEVLVLLVAGLLGWPLPLTALQILWLNLLTDVFPALALAVEPGEPDVMERPPRDPTEGILSRSFLSRIGGYGALVTVATLVPFAALLHRGASEQRAMTVAFVVLALAQLFHVVNARSAEPILLRRRLFANRWMFGAVALTVVLQVAAVYLPGLSDVLDTVPLGWGDWCVVLAAAAMPALAGQAVKGLRRGRGR